MILSFATIVEGGAVAACLVLQPMLPYLMDLARGYPLHPPQSHKMSTLEHLVDIEELTTRQEVMLGLVWLAASFLVAAALVYRDGNFQNLNVARIFSRYSPLSTEEEQEKLLGQKRSLAPLQPAPVASSEAYNMFDPADLPPRLAEYANMVYSACEDLGNFFGFQDSSVRNQAEHLLILLSNNRRYMSSHILPPSVQPPSPIHALHAKVFSNYVKWCRAMGVPPHFSKMNTSMNAPPAVASRVVDLVLYFCIWGEGANLRHMPECVWFLYHKMMEEYIRSEGYTQTRSLYAGHFLDNVVAPIVFIVGQVSDPRTNPIYSASALQLNLILVFVIYRACVQKLIIRTNATTTTSMNFFGRGIVSVILICLLIQRIAIWKGQSLVEFQVKD